MAILRCVTSPQEALKATKLLIGSWPHANPPDPQGWAASLAAALAGYPLGLVQECCDPRTGLARSREFPPTVQSIVDWCDRRLKYHTGMVKWGEQIVHVPDFSDDHRKNMLGRLKALFSTLWSSPPDWAKDPEQQQAAE